MKWLLILILLIGIAGADKYDRYLGENITVNMCNETAIEGVLIENGSDYIVIDEVCNPELGNVTILKNCIIWVHECVECDKWR
jgi:hypothetical protein